MCNWRVRNKLPYEGAKLHKKKNLGKLDPK